MNKIKWKTLIILFVIVISFSPLFSNVFKAIALAAILLISIFKVRKFHNGNIILLLIVLLLLIMPASIDIIRNWGNANISVLNFYFPFCFLFGYIIYQRYTLQEYLLISEKIIFVLALFSLIGVIIYTFIPQLVFHLPQYVNKHTTHRTAYLFNILIIGRNVVPRNAGFAWEPGAFQFLLNMGFFTQLKYNKFNIFKIIIYTISILTTRSTVGLFIFAIIIVFQLIINQENKKIRILAILMVAISLGSAVDTIRYHIIYKLNPDSISFDARFSPMLNAVNYGKKYLLGIGNSTYDQVYNQLNLGSFDSYTQIFIRYGYLLLFCVLFRLYRTVKNNIVLGAIIIITFFGQSIWFFPFITPFYFLIEERRV